MMKPISVSVATALGVLGGVAAVSAQSTMSRETTTTTTTTTRAPVTLAPDVRTHVRQYVVPASFTFLTSRARGLQQHAPSNRARAA
jgi:hypothetical protein